MTPKTKLTDEMQRAWERFAARHGVAMVQWAAWGFVFRTAYRAGQRAERKQRGTR